MADNNDNIFSSFKGLFWGAIVGVASFQVLAPNIWGYMHDALKMPYSRAYWFFTIVYFISMPICMMLWLAWNRKLLIKYFPPYNNPDKADNKYNVALWSLFGVIGIEFLFTIIAFLHHFKYGENFYRIIFYVFAIFCLIFLVFFAIEAYLRIEKETEIDYNNQEKVKKTYLQLIVPTFVFAALLFIIGNCYIANWIDDKALNQYQGKSQSSVAAGYRGFALVDLKDSLDDRYNYLGKLEDNIRYNHIGDTLNLIRGSTTNNFYLLEKPHHDTVIINADKTLTDFDLSLSLINNFIRDSIFKKLEDTTLADVSDNLIDSISSEVLKLKINDTEILRSGNELHFYGDDIIYIDMLKTFIGSISREADAQSKNQLGLQLRSVQIKGMSLLISLFFSMFSLYIFLSINQTLQNTILKKAQEDKRIKKENFDAVDEKELITKENNEAESTKISYSLWLCLTVIVWLLVPLFKPVKEADINIKEPYKSPTFSNPDYSFTNNPQSAFHSNDTIMSYQVKIDSIRVSDTLYKKELDNINTKLQAIKDKANDIEGDH